MYQYELKNLLLFQNKLAMERVEPITSLQVSIFPVISASPRD